MIDWVSLFVGEKITAFENNIRQIVQEQIENIKNVSNNLISKRIEDLKKNYLTQIR